MNREHCPAPKYVSLMAGSLGYRLERRRGLYWLNDQFGDLVSDPAGSALADLWPVIYDANFRTLPNRDVENDR